LAVCNSREIGAWAVMHRLIYHFLFSFYGQCSAGLKFWVRLVFPRSPLNHRFSQSSAYG
jgi:hypothetical protein